MNQNTEATYENVEAMLQAQFSVLAMVRDERGDDGDDGGYIVAFSVDGKGYYLHVLEVNYEMELSDYRLSGFCLDGDEDYIKANDINELIPHLQRLIQIADLLPEDHDLRAYLDLQELDEIVNDDDPEFAADFSQEFKDLYAKLNTTEKLFLGRIAFPYGENLKASHAALQSMIDVVT